MNVYLFRSLPHCFVLGVCEFDPLVGGGCAVLAQKVQKRLTLFLEHLVAHIGNDDCAVHLAHAQLVGRVEFADAIHLITKQLNPIC